MEKDNPCFGCQRVIEGKIQRAPCCHNSTLVVDTKEYLRLFLKYYNSNILRVDEVLDTNGDQYFYIYLNGACPYLTDEGLCGIEDEKPLGCRNFIPGNFVFCIIK